MKYLVDTCIVSELANPRCDPGVKRFMASLDTDTLYISTVSLGELQYGVDKLPNSKKKKRLAEWLAKEVLPSYYEHIIEVDTAVALKWGTLRATHNRTLPLVDALLAATALARDLTLLTRNTRDFAGIAGLSLRNPWEG
jgi:predicted nucleic acid-binding protein